MLMPLEAEVKSFHASAGAYLRPQSSSLRHHQHPAGRDRPRLFDSERFKRKFVTTLADLRGELGFRIGGSPTFMGRRGGRLPCVRPTGSRMLNPDYCILSLDS